LLLIDRARRKQTQRHGGGTAKVEFDEFDRRPGHQTTSWLPSTTPLTTLAAALRQAEVVKLRYFLGLQNEDVAALMGILVSTVKKLLDFARGMALQRNRGE